MMRGIALYDPELHPAKLAAPPLTTQEPRLQRAEGRARISFRQRAGATRLDRLFQLGCAKIRLPKPPAGATPEAILINTAGGLTGGDSFDVEVDLAEGTAATITTQACERIYRSLGGPAKVSTTLRAARGARLAWLPQETILFDRGELSRRLEADLAGDAELIAVETVVFGRSAMGERVRRGALHDRWRIRRDGQLVFADDLRFDGDINYVLARAAVLGERIAMATLLHVGQNAERFVDPLREAIAEDGGVSAWEGKLVARLCDGNALALRRRLEAALLILLDGRALPRVWQF